VFFFFFPGGNESMKRVSRSCLYILTIAGFLPIAACDTAPTPAPTPKDTAPVAKPADPKGEITKLPPIKN
jgi:hypothetical protein